MRNRIVFSGIILTLLLCVFQAAAWEIQGVEGHLGMIWYGNSEKSYTASPLKGSLGAAVPIEISPKYEFRPELELFFFDYVWDSAAERAVPAAIETANRIGVLHMMLNPAFLMKFSPWQGETLSLAVSLSPSLLIRIPFTARDAGADTRADLTGYLYSAGRFLYPSAGALLRWRYREKLVFTLGARVYIPVFNLWDSSGISFYDQMIISGSAGFRVPF